MAYFLLGFGVPSHARDAEFRGKTSGLGDNSRVIPLRKASAEDAGRGVLGLNSTSTGHGHFSEAMPCTSYPTLSLFTHYNCEAFLFAFFCARMADLLLVERVAGDARFPRDGGLKAGR